VSGRLGLKDTTKVFPGYTQKTRRPTGNKFKGNIGAGDESTVNELYAKTGRAVMGNRGPHFFSPALSRFRAIMSA
jgi:hypothetical protein